MGDKRDRRLAKILATSSSTPYSELEEQLELLIEEFSSLSDTRPYILRYALMFAVDRNQPCDVVGRILREINNHPNASPRSKFGATMDYAFYCRDIGNAESGIETLLELQSKFSDTDYRELQEGPEAFARLIAMMKTRD